MAGVVAAAIAAEQVIMTGVEAAAAVAIAAPTAPLKMALTQLDSPDGDVDLTRSNHTLTVIGDKAYLFGGVDASGNLCLPTVHAISLPQDKSQTDPLTSKSTSQADYPPFPTKDISTGDLNVPTPRQNHAACARGNRYILIHGGEDASGKPIEEDNVIWQWDSETLAWTKLRGTAQLYKSMAPRSGHSIFVDDKQGFLVSLGGSDDQTKREVWFYDFNQAVWTALPDLPSGKEFLDAAAYAGNTLYVLTKDASDPSAVSLLSLYLYDNATDREKPLPWETHTFEAPSPCPQVRERGALVPIMTGYGREYLVYMLGLSSDGTHGSQADIWTLQLPSRGITGAKVKDYVREKLPKMTSGELTWAEVELVPMEQMEKQGKVHPGPRGSFGVDSFLGGRGVVFWGGVNPRGEREGDGWILRLASGYEDYDRKE
ncbi:hypothetical protein QBC40DRAFT_6000 [Triangularia verruculosa]|uniref:Uncharacterized protein n=1 Tax=Triangularia verruculosa TaxID=2587418 RepID=A0AAN6X9M2_9PEZI|nr:hypothetical protein QBC40DRAFT_6000 [Triangularia verruculosa]